MRFAHLGDCHLGGWRLPELQELNLIHFKFAMDKCIKEKVDFILVAGDLFDSAYPPIDTIKDTFEVFRRIKEARIPVFLIAGSHDYSASGKTFLDVLEKAGFVENAFKPEYHDDKIVLNPIIYKGAAIYGFPGRKSGLEVKEIEKIKLNEAPGLYTILMLHTSIRDAIGSLPIPAVDETKLPKVDYVALAHLHLKYEKNNRVYCGPTFPNNAAELEDLKGGSFYFVDTGKNIPERQEIKLKEVIVIDMDITDAITATDKIRLAIKELNIRDKIVILKVAGLLERGKIADINFQDLGKAATEQGAYVMLRNTAKLQTKEAEISIELKSDDIEAEILEKYQTDNPHKFNALIQELFSVLQLDKKEDEKLKVFEDRLLSDVKKIVGV